MKLKIVATQKEVVLGHEELIISKTDLKGRITYVNRTFMRLANFSEQEVLGQQHNIVRHPDMPRGTFKLLWDTLQQGREFFGYVKNMTADGDYYWVFANVTPDLDARGKHVGYFSVRRRPGKEAIAVIEPLYREMLAVEKAAGVANAPAASVDFLNKKLQGMGTTYDRFILSL
ncbi:MAG: PAS domain-containing protein [Sideroxydans sp.]|nr:PAS domain-containing protein [Sideroxydans sp.]